MENNNQENTVNVSNPAQLQHQNLNSEIRNEQPRFFNFNINQ